MTGGGAWLWRVAKTHKKYKEAESEKVHVYGAKKPLEASCTDVDIHDLIMCAKFDKDWIEGLGVARGQISGFPTDCIVNLYNTAALQCECVKGTYSV